MVSIKTGKTYTCTNSDIKVKVLNIIFKRGDIIKAKLAISSKHYIEIKNYRLNTNLIQHWREL
jgi:hypothetical protein